MSERRIDRTGRSQFTRKSTPSEVARRDVLLVKLRRRGHSTAEISEALGVATSTVLERLTKLGFKGKIVKGHGRVTEPCPWRDEDMPELLRQIEPPRWRQSRIVQMAQMLNDEYHESNFTNVLANQATDADEHGDKDWQLEALATFSAAIEKLERARRVLTDDHYRTACRDTLEGVEQMRHKHTMLRIVT